jgi:hypothetical protein
MASKQVRHITHDELVEAGYRWLLNQGCAFAFKELGALSYEIPDVVGFKNRDCILIECKATRQDFLKDKKKLFRQHPQLGMGKFRFYLCSPDLIKVKDLPEKWGLIYSTGKRCKVIHNPYNESGGNMWSNGFPEHNLHHEIQLCHSALRRLHIHGLIDQIYSYDKLYVRK